MAITDLGDILGGIGDVKPETIKLLHDRERMGITAARDAALSDYYKSLIGQASTRMSLEQKRLSQLDRPFPFGSKGGVWNPNLGTWETKPQEEPYVINDQLVMPDGKGGYKAITPEGITPKVTKRTPADLAMEAENMARIIAQEPLSAQNKYSLIEGIPNLSIASRKAWHEELLGPAPAKPSFKDQQILDSLKKKLGRDATAEEFNAESARLESERWTSEESFDKWEPEAKQLAFINRFYSGKDPGFAYRDVKSKNAFQHQYVQWMIKAGLSPIDAITARSDIGSRQKAVNTLTQREGLIDIFVDRIELNAQVVRDLQAKYNRNEFGRLFNMAQNYVVRWFVPNAPYRKSGGSGDLEALQFALWSLSQEVAKVETGQLGIAAPSVTQAQEMVKIHDVNLNVADLETVISTSLWLGRTSKEAMRHTRDSMLAEIGQVGLFPRPVTPLATPPSPGGTSDEDARKGLAKSDKFKSMKDGDEVKFNGRVIGIKKGNAILPPNTPITSPSAQPQSSLDQQIIRLHRERKAWLNKHSPRNPMKPMPGETPEDVLIRRSVNEGWDDVAFDKAAKELLTRAQ